MSYDNILKEVHQTSMIKEVHQTSMSYDTIIKELQQNSTITVTDNAVIISLLDWNFKLHHHHHILGNKEFVLGIICRYRLMKDLYVVFGIPMSQSTISEDELYTLQTHLKQPNNFPLGCISR